jgi:enamine deaminase RidA (YjgF/YER057c/UK114 family)
VWASSASPSKVPRLVGCRWLWPGPHRLRLRKTAEGPNLATQTGLIFDQIAADLERLGGSLADTVRITAYLTSLDEYAEYSRIRGERFGGNPPASAAVQVAALLQGALIEIDALAFLSA